MSSNSVPSEKTPLVASATTSVIASPIAAFVTTALTIVTIVLTVAIVILAIVAVTTNGELDARSNVKKSPQSSEE